MNKNYNLKYEEWLNSNYIDESDKKELKLIYNDEKEKEERFYKDLTFGTGGIRGIRGLGTNRINKYVVRKVSQGLANYMLKFNEEEAKKQGIIIAYDCRIGSEEYAINTAMVMAANGIKVYLYESLRSTPELSFGLRNKKCMSGIVITASHNPKEYNGYKVYWNDGAQVVEPHASGIVSEVNSIDSFDDIKIMDFEEAKNKGYVIYLDEKIDEEYLEEIKKQRINKNIKGTEDFKIVYTPLHGTGGRPIIKLFEDLSYNFEVVQEQIKPDGNFPTVEFANPEEKEAYKYGIKTATECGANLIISNDPDSDRIGIVVKDNNDNWYYPNGNQLGLLLFQYILKYKKEIPKNSKIITTIVSTPMIDVVSKNNGIDCFKTLTGFKYIGEKIREFENKTIDGSFLFGFEESYGYLVGTHSRDKDGLVTSMLVAEMAIYYNSIGSSIYKELQNLYKEYGYFLEGIKSLTLEGKDGIEKMQKLLKDLRVKFKNSLLNKKIKTINDYYEGTELNLAEDKTNKIDLPKENVLQFILEDNTYITVRPSGTEPKIKFYFSVNSDSFEKANEKLELTMNEFLKEIKEL